MNAKIKPPGGLGWLLPLCLLLGPFPVQAQSALRIRTPSNAVELKFQGAQGTASQVQWIGSFGPTNWTTLTNVILTSNQLVTVVHPGVTNLSRRFYRLAISSPPSNPHPSELVWIFPGTFVMGSPSNEAGRYSREGPTTQVTLTRGFWMGRHEVQQFEYEAVMNSNPSLKPGPYRPVDSVSWHDATNYCGRRTTQERAAGKISTNHVYRLPTEAEWEYAARAGTSTRFSYGNDDASYSLLSNYGWHDEDGLDPNHDSESLLPNPWGLYDMHGNVYEWCLDWYVSGYPGGSVTDPKGPATGTRRILRSGSCVSFARDLRSAYRDYYEPVTVFANAGLRVVLAPIGP